MIHIVGFAGVCLGGEGELLGKVCGVEGWVQVHQWIVGQRGFGNCYRVSVLGRGIDR
jgi:hypothetical protein